MKHILKIAMIVLAATALWGCYQEPQPLDNPFVYITTASAEGYPNTQTRDEISAQSNNLTYELYVWLSTKAFVEDIVVEYEVVVGDGLKEGVDFVVQKSAASPMTFKPGTYKLPLRISWRKTENLDPTKDNTVTFRLTRCSRSDFTLGLLGPDALCREFVFTKK